MEFAEKPLFPLWLRFRNEFHMSKARKPLPTDVLPPNPQITYNIEV